MARSAATPEPYREGLSLSAAGRYLEAIEKFEAALSCSPSDVRVLFALGNTARALGMSGPAMDFYRRVLVVEPGRIEALVNLANLLRAMSRHESAEALLVPALTQNDGAAELWLTLGSVYREMGHRNKAIMHYSAALERRRDYVPALVNLGDMRADENNISEAFVLYDRALRLEPHNPQARLNRAVLHLLKGNLREGWRDYAGRLSLPSKVPIADHGLPHWSGNALKRATLLVTAEQGVGDQIMFASVIPALQQRAASEGGRIVLECEPRLESLFARSFPEVSVCASVIEMQDGVAHGRYRWLKSAGGASLAVELGTLPRYLRATTGSFPAPHAYLRPNPSEQSIWRVQLGSGRAGPLVGICWRSGNMAGHRALQYAPAAAWAEFIRELPGTIVCAQYDAGEEEIRCLESLSGREILQPSALNQKHELDRTAAMLSALDYVVSAPTAVSWLAGATGTKTLKVLFDTSWTSFGEAYEPFAPACKLIAPDTPGDWRNAFARVRQLII
jgi:Flp pilus assembly protein TadD